MLSWDMEYKYDSKSASSFLSAKYKRFKNIYNNNYAIELSFPSFPLLQPLYSWTFLFPKKSVIWRFWGLKCDSFYVRLETDLIIHNTFTGNCNENIDKSKNELQNLFVASFYILITTCFQIKMLFISSFQH